MTGIRRPMVEWRVSSNSGWRGGGGGSEGHYLGQSLATGWDASTDFLDGNKNQTKASTPLVTHQFVPKAHVSRLQTSQSDVDINRRR